MMKWLCVLGLLWGVVGAAPANMEVFIEEVKGSLGGAETAEEMVFFSLLKAYEGTMGFTPPLDKSAKSLGRLLDRCKEKHVDLTGETFAQGKFTVGEVAKYTKNMCEVLAIFAGTPNVKNYLGSVNLYLHSDAVVDREELLELKQIFEDLHVEVDSNLHRIEELL